MRRWTAGRAREADESPVAVRRWRARRRSGAGRFILAWTPVLLSPDPAGAVPRPRQASPVVVVRDWLPVGAIAMALPAPPSTALDEAAARVADLALLGTLREAAGGLAVRVGMTRTRTGRHFVATVAPEDLPELLRVMRQVAVRPLPARHVASASARYDRERGFRQGSPQDRFEQLFSSALASAGGDGAANAPPAPAAHAGAGVLPARVAAAGADGGLSDPVPAETVAAKAGERPQAAWGAPAWVVVADTVRARLLGFAPPAAEAADAFVPPPPSPGRGASLPAPAAAPEDAGSPAIADFRETAEVVTTWVGLAYRLPPGTPPAQAALLRAVLVANLERRRDDALWALSAEIGPARRLLVHFAAAPDAARRWESRIDEAMAAIGAGRSASAAGTEGDLAGLLRAVRGQRSRALSDPARLAQAAAGALLRGASPSQVLSLVRGGADAAEAERVALVARGARLEVRVEYGAAAR